MSVTGIGGYDGPKAGTWRTVIAVASIALVAGLVLAVACYVGIRDLGDNERELRRIAVADPAADLESALAAGDRRFLLLKEFGEDLVPGATVPGVGPEEKRYLSECGLRVIEVPLGLPDRDELEAAARRYVVAYNRQLLARLKAGGGE